MNVLCKLKYFYVSIESETEREIERERAQTSCCYYCLPQEGLFEFEFLLRNYNLTFFNVGHILPCHSSVSLRLWLGTAETIFVISTKGFTVILFHTSACPVHAAELKNKKIKKKLSRNAFASRTNNTHRAVENCIFYS